MKLLKQDESQVVVADQPETIAPGDYFHSERDLYRVERREAERVLIEDCRTGVLIDIDLDRLLPLERVRR